jgi:hypothetical protein
MIEHVTTVLDASAPAVGWASGPLGEAQAADRELSRQAARRYRAIAAFAATRPASADRQQGSPGAMSAERWASRPEVLRPVSEWAAHEVSLALDISTQRAEEELERSLLLVHRLPLALDALESGLLHTGHLWCLLEHVAPIADDDVRARVERELLGWMAARQRVTTPAQLGERVRRVVARDDARNAARDLARALRRRGVAARPDRVAGMSVVSALLTTPEAAALLTALGAYADALPADARTRGERMADCLLDLVLRPAEHGLAPVQVALTVVAPVGALLGGDQPCEVDGQVVPAEVVRALLAALTGAPLVTAGAGSVDAGQPGGPVLTAEEDFALWSAEFQRRILAGEFDDAPPPDAPDEDGPPDLGPPPTAPLASDPHASPPVPDGWWARADRAVDDAGAAVLAAQRALGHARQVVATAQRADTADEAAWALSSAGRVTAAPDALTALAAATDEARDTLAGVLRATAGGGLADRPRFALTDALTGTLLTLTDLPALHRAATAGSGLAVPAAVEGYRPGAALDRHVRARDRRCRFPGCRRPVPRTGELDHATPWPAGPTAAANLTGYCTGHHRGKHQAPGWRHDLAPDGTLTVTTPTGLVATTSPPPY